MSRILLVLLIFLTHPVQASAGGEIFETLSQSEAQPLSLDAIEDQRSQLLIIDASVPMLPLSSPCQILALSSSLRKPADRAIFSLLHNLPPPSMHLIYSQNC